MRRVPAASPASLLPPCRAPPPAARPPARPRAAPAGEVHLRHRGRQVGRQQLLVVVKLQEAVPSMPGEVEEHVGPRVAAQLLGQGRARAVPTWRAGSACRRGKLMV